VVDHEPDDILELTRHINGEGRCVAVVVSSDKSPEVIRKAMRAGARDFAFIDPIEADVARAVREVSVVSAEAAPSGRGKVITIFGCKGGSGATTIALNLAGALMDADGPATRSVVVLDLVLEMGDVLISLDLSSGYNFHDVLANMHRLDVELLR